MKKSQSIPPSVGKSNTELTAARNYWRQIENATRGRWLHGAELAIAQQACSHYAQQIRSAVEIWVIGETQELRDYAQWVQQELLEGKVRGALRFFRNLRSSVVTDESIVVVIHESDVTARTAKIEGHQKAERIDRLFARLYAEIEKRLPSAPQSASIPNITAAELAFIANQLAALADEKSVRPTQSFFSQAREILIQAQSFIAEQRIEEVKDSAFEASGVTFDKILEPQRESMRHKLKLLPGFSGGTESKGYDRHKGLINLIRRFYRLCDPPEDPERFIRQKFLPTKELVRIRWWYFRQRRRASLKEH